MENGQGSRGRLEAGRLDLAAIAFRCLGFEEEEDGTRGRQAWSGLAGEGCGVDFARPTHASVVLAGLGTQAREDRAL